MSGLQLSEEQQEGGCHRCSYQRTASVTVDEHFYISSQQKKKKKRKKLKSFLSVILFEVLSSLSLHFTCTIINVESPGESQMTGTVRMRLCHGWIETEKESPSWSGGQYLPAAAQITVFRHHSSRAAPLEVRRHLYIIIIIIIRHHNSLFPTPQSTFHPVPCAPVRTGQDRRRAVLTP